MRSHRSSLQTASAFVLGNQMGFSPSEATLPLDLKKSTEGFWKSFISGLHSRQKKLLKRPTRYFTTWQRTFSLDGSIADGSKSIPIPAINPLPHVPFVTFLQIQTILT